MTQQSWPLEQDETVTIKHGGNVWRHGPEVGSIRLGHVQRMHKHLDPMQWNAMTADGHSFVSQSRAEGVRWLIEQAGLHLQS